MRHDRFATASLIVCCTLAAGTAYAQNTAGAPGLSPTAELQKNSPTPMSGVQNNETLQRRAHASSNDVQDQTATKKKREKKSSSSDSGGATNQPASGSTSG
jgi:hypothetical protein